MSVLWRAALTASILAAATAAGTVAAPDRVAAASSGPAQAVVLVSTPELPTGRSGTARGRWHRLRAGSRRILDGVARSNGLTVASAVPEIGLLAVDVGPGGLLALRHELAADPRVLSVRPDVPVEPRYSPNDFAFNNADAHAPSGDFGQWNLIHEGGPGAWDLSKGDGAEVAMIDSGVDGSHPDLRGRIAAAQAFGTSSPTTDTNGHGTHTAGLACGQGDNAYGIASLGFHCSLFIAKIDFSGPCSNVASAITAAANRNSDVINMSFGSCDSALIPALTYAQARGSILVSAADNEPSGDGSYPEEWIQPLGTGPDTSSNRGLVVTSARADGARSSFAESTTRVSVAAYGSAGDSTGGQQGILSSWPVNSTIRDTGVPMQFGPCNCRTAVNGDSRFAYLSGTSMSTPQVSGVAALIRAVKPDMPNTQVVRLIKATANHCGVYGDGVGWGIVRADEAVVAALDRDFDPPTSQVIKAKRIRKTRRGPVFKLRLHAEETSTPRCASLPISGVNRVIVFAKAKGKRKGRRRGKKRGGWTYHRIGETAKPFLIFHAKRHRRYRFYSVAVDNQGNSEAPPPTPDVKR